MRRFHAVGGMQLQVYLLTRELALQGIKQDVITVRPPWEPEYEEKDGVRIHRYGWPIATPRQMYAVPALGHVLKIQSSDYDLIHCHTAQDLASIPLSVLAARRASMPLVISLHSSWQFTYKAPGPYQWVRQRIGCWVEKKGLHYADAVIVLTSGMAEKLISSGKVSPSKVFVIPDAIDLENVCRRPQQNEVRKFLKKYNIPVGPHVVFLGRLSHQKGVTYLIKAVGELKRHGTKATLILAGDGPYRAEIQKEVARQGISDRTIFTGFIHHDDVPVLLCSANVLVVPSIYEEFGSVLLEAMAAGVPIIASRVGGIPFTIRHGQNGLLVDPKNISELAESIHSILSDNALAQSLGNRAALDAQNYSLSKLARAVIDRVYMPIIESVREARSQVARSVNLTSDR